MNHQQPLFIPVLLGTTRKGCFSRHAARFVHTEVAKRAGVETELLNIDDYNFPSTDEGEAIKDPRFAALMERADALIIVAPEYNRGYPGSLKHALDTCLKEYIHKAVGVCGVSSGPFGGARVIENLLPVLRELGLVTIFWDVNFGSVQKLFDESGRLLDEAFVGRTDKFLKELIWMATVLRHGRQDVPLG